MRAQSAEATVSAPNARSGAEGPQPALDTIEGSTRYHDVLEVINLLAPLVVSNAGLIALAVCLIVHFIRRGRRCDRLIQELKRKHCRLSDLIDWSGGLSLPMPGRVMLNGVHETLTASSSK